jgi:large subunit ribosomal protein L30e
MSITELRSGLKEGKIVFGTERTEKLVKQGKVKEVFMASNVAENLAGLMKEYCEISGCKLSKLDENSKDLGAICKKPFSISVCCYVK